MRFDFIKRVVLHTLNAEKNDRRGVIATFFLDDKLPKEASQPEGIMVVQGLLSLLDYRCHKVLLNDERRGKPGEQSKCWINADEQTIRLRHKHLNQAEIDAFTQLVKVIAPLHKWEVTQDEAPQD